MRARTEAYGWAVFYGPGAGLATVAAQDAARSARPGWAVLFVVLAVLSAPVYFALQWRELAAP